MSGELGLPTVRWEERWAHVGDAGAQQSYDRHYVYHAAWAARVVRDLRPDVHVDIGSTIPLAAMLSAFVSVEYYDYQLTTIELDNLVVGEADLTALLSLIAASTLCHVCTPWNTWVSGRYGDPLHPQGDRKAIAELQRVLAPDGSLLFVVPVGVPRVVFNAHRVYGFDDVMGAFPELELVEFARIPNLPSHGHLIRDADPTVLADRLTRRSFPAGVGRHRRDGETSRRCRPRLVACLLVSIDPLRPVAGLWRVLQGRPVGERLRGGGRPRRSCGVVPVYRRVLDEDELVSLRHLERFLAGYDRYLVEPARLGLELPGFGVERFRDSYFGSTRAYSSLLVSKEFYRRFLAYETSTSINSTASSSQMSYDFVGPVHEIEGVCGWSETAASRYAASGDALPF